MTQYSPVAPVEVLQQMKLRNMLSNYLLLLAHEVVNKPHAYAQLLDGFDGTIILDNSLIELGTPVDMSVMLTAAAIVKPNFVVMPDMLGDRVATVSMTTAAIQQYGSKFIDGTGFMVAAQGNDVNDAVWCVEEIVKKHKSAHFMVGIPREVTNRQGSRIPLTSQLTARKYQVHLLGMSNNFKDDVSSALIYGVQGIDSASPVRAGWDNLVYTGQTSHLRPREEYFEQCRGFNMMMAYNVGMIEGLIGAKK